MWTLSQKIYKSRFFALEKKTILTYGFFSTLRRKGYAKVQTPVCDLRAICWEILIELSAENYSNDTPGPQRKFFDMYISKNFLKGKILDVRKYLIGFSETKRVTIIFLMI
jgi:hypothetical protein